MAIGMTNTPGVLEATTTTPGLMSAADKTKLDNEVLANLLTTEKGSLVGAVNELYTGKATFSKNVTLYVAPGGNDTTGDGTSEHPFATPNRALDALGEYCIGCTIIIKSGTYKLDASNWGDGKDAAIYINKVGGLTIKGESENDLPVLNVTGGRVASTYRCSVGLSAMHINYTGISDGVAKRLFFSGHGCLLSIGKKIEVVVDSPLQTNVFVVGSKGQIVIGSDGVNPKISFVNKTNQKYRVAWAIYGFIFIVSIQIMSGDGLCAPAYGNCTDGGVILVKANINYGSLTSENVFATTTPGMIVHGHFLYPNT